MFWVSPLKTCDGKHYLYSALNYSNASAWAYGLSLTFVGLPLVYWMFVGLVALLRKCGDDVVDPSHDPV